LHGGDFAVPEVGDCVVVVVVVVVAVVFTVELVVVAVVWAEELVVVVVCAVELVVVSPEHPLTNTIPMIKMNIRDIHNSFFNVILLR
jgi:hypothetical protein